MKIQIASDLHLEFLQRDYPGERIIGPVPGAEVLILAGDIAVGADVFTLFSSWPTPTPVPIIFVAGNHEFYHHVLDPMRLKMEKTAANFSMHYLENSSVVIGNARFLGTTLWTDYKLDANRPQADQMRDAERSLNDHRLIRTGRHMFTAQDALDRFNLAKDWLTQELAKPFEGKTVVVTHHACHPLSVHPRHKGSPINSAFTSDMSELMQSVDLWIHGHTHDNVDYKVDRCRVVSNQAGYCVNRTYARRDDWIFENKAFDRNFMVEI